MSFFDGNLTGRVIIVDASADLRSGMALVMQRDRIVRITCDVDTQDVGGMPGLAYLRVTVGEHDHVMEMVRETAISVVRSVLTEDGDVIWTRLNGGWVRTPDECAP